MNLICSLYCFCFDSNNIQNKFKCLVCTWFQYLYINSKDTVNCILTPNKNLLTLASKILQFLLSFKLGNSISSA